MATNRLMGRALSVTDKRNTLREDEAAVIGVLLVLGHAGRAVGQLLPGGIAKADRMILRHQHIEKLRSGVVEFTTRPAWFSVNAAFVTSPPLTTSLMTRPNVRANSQSRSSCPGTAMIAPVP